MRIDSDGELGVGTTSPTARVHAYSATAMKQLTVDGAGTIKTGINFANSGNTYGQIYFDNNSPFDMSVLQQVSIGSLRLGTNDTERMRISSGGEVGIGSTATTYKLNIQNASASAFDGMQVAGDNASYNLIFQSGSVSASGTLFGVNKARGQFISSNNSPITIGTLDAFPLVFGTNATERMRIDSSGNVGIGTASPDQKLVVSGNTTSAIQRIFNLNAVNTYQMSFHNSVGEVGTISTGSGSTAYNTSSDYRLKENVVPMTNALATVAQLKPCTYTWKSDGKNGQGFIAHELQAVVPQCVTGEKDAVETYTDEDGNEQTRIKPQGVDTSFLVATLTSAIQELKAELDTVKAELQTLKGN